MQSRRTEKLRKKGSVLSGQKREAEGRKKEELRVREEGEKMRNECRALAVEGPHDFSFPRRAVKIARVQPPRPRCVPGKLRRPYYRHNNNKVNALQIKRTRKTFRVALCSF